MTRDLSMSEQIKLLRIYTDEAAYYSDRRVFEVIASKARDARLGGVTVLEALIGFGRRTCIAGTSSKAIERW